VRALLSSLLVLGILTGTGCHKNEKQPPGVPSAEITNQQAKDHMPVPAQTPAANPALVARPNRQPDLAELNRSLLRWMMRNRRPPKNFEDFAATAGVTIPPPPPGKKYIIASDMHIKLVNK
jgi:hypothetical protein